jgi:hypothetical protein
VSDGAGRVTVPANSTRHARLGIGAADVWVTGRVSVDRIPVGGHAFAYVLARANANNAYRATIRVTKDTGAVFVNLKKLVSNAESTISADVNTGLVAVPDTFLRYRFEVVDDQLRFKVWEIGAGEPAGWQVTANDSSLSGNGAAGLTTYTGKQVTNGPVTFRLDTFEVRRGA